MKPFDSSVGSSLRDDIRVLIVDDGPAVLKALSRILRPYYDIEASGSGVLALALLAEVASFDLVLCDLHLLDVDGLEVYEMACARRSDLRGRFLFMTGDSDFAVPGFGDASGAVHVLKKPFSSAELRSAVVEALVHLSPRAAG